VKSWRWTVAKYDRAYELGWFDGQRVELIEGRVVRMSPQLEPHVAAISIGMALLPKLFGEGFTVRCQAPLQFGLRSKPEPDFAVVPGEASTYLSQGCPTSALLVIEVSDKTLAYDRGRKAGTYATNGIQDYWILNLVDRQLEVHRRPVPTSRRHFRHADVVVLKPEQQVSALMRPDLIIRVSDLLPKFPS
jgi:Uma2 family endonuclease